MSSQNTYDFLTSTFDRIQRLGSGKDPKRFPVSQTKSQMLRVVYARQITLGRKRRAFNAGVKAEPAAFYNLETTDTIFFLCDRCVP